MSSRPPRELTRDQRAAIRKQVTKCCANYDNQDQLCLPLDCPCYMLQKWWTGSYCRYFREAVLPADPALESAITGEDTSMRQTPKKRRLALVNAFNADDTPVFLVSLKAGGTGLNLTGASVVVHADPWWNAAAQNQATDRAHRIGQDKVVSVQKVIAKGTIEERIMRLQEAKSDLAEQIVGAGGVSLASLTREDLIDLLQG